MWLSNAKIAFAAESAALSYCQELPLGFCSLLMGWYVSKGSDVAGPLDEVEIHLAIEQGEITGGMFVLEDLGGPWEPIELSPFAAKVSASQGPPPGQLGSG